MRLPLQHRTVQKRNGFTLIELLVVIAILALLMALTLGVMSKVYSYLDETKVNAEVNRLVESCNLFKAQFGRYPPGKILIAEQGVVYQTIINPATTPVVPGYTPQQVRDLASYSVDYLSSIFPGINLTANHNWNGSLDASGNPIIDNGFAILEGQQCLVFFLGGLNYGSNTPVGFNTDKTNPTARSNGARLGPFYEFDAGRLTATGGSAQFPAYNDPYGTPYAYFAAKTPGMNNYPNRHIPNFNQSASDCESITTLVPGNLYFVPYFQGNVPTTSPAGWAAATSFKFMKADTFQIVSAGKDKLFGTGGQWNQADPEQSVFLPPSVLPSVTTDMLQANYDNITNFAGGRVVPK